MLSQIGFSNIEVANDGVEGVEKYSKNDYDIIFMDIMMPRMDGLTATKEIVRLMEGRRIIPIVGTSANASPSDKQLGMDAGMFDYLEKPLSIAKIVPIFEKIKNSNYKTMP